MNLYDFGNENSICSPQSSRSNSSGAAFNPSHLGADINSSESNDEINPYEIQSVIKKDNINKKSFKDDHSMESESNIIIYSNDSGTKQCPNYSNSSSNDANNDYTKSSNQQKTASNIDGNIFFNDFSSSKNESDSEESFDPKNSSKNVDQRKNDLRQNFSLISKQVLSIDDEIEDEIHISDTNTDEKPTFPCQTSHSKEKAEDIHYSRQKMDENDLTFFTSNKSYMSNTNVEKEEVIVQEPKMIRNTARKSGKKRIKGKRRLTPEEKHAIRMQQLKQYALNFNQLDDPPISITDEEYDELIQILNEERRKHISERNFIEGDKMNKVISTVMQNHEKKKKKELQQQEYNKYLTQHELFLNSLKKFDQETEEILQQIETKNNEMTEDLQKKHDNELSEHYSKWMSEAKMRQYNHASQKLLNQRMMVDVLLNQCRFNEAKELQIEIEQIEKEEEKLAAAQMQHDYEESLKALNEKQEKEEKFLNEKCKMKVTQARQRRQIERTTLMNKEKKFIKMKEQVSSPDKVWNAMQNQRINQIYKKNLPPPMTRTQQTQQQVIQQRDRQWRQKEAMSRRRCEMKTLPPMENSEASSAKKIQQQSLRLPGTARQPTTSTVIKLPPLKIKKPMKKSRLSHSAR